MNSSLLSYLGFLFFLASCSGAQMISSDDQTVSEATVVKKKENIQQDPELNSEALNRGVFDARDVQLKTDLTQWKLIQDEDGIQTYEKLKSQSGLVAFRGEIFIPVPLKKVATILVDDALQKEWVDSFVENRQVSGKSEFDTVEYNQTKVPWPFQNRDFVFRVLAKVHVSPPTMLITMKSVEESSVPPVKGIVRGEIVHSYYYLKEIQGVRATKMVVEMEVDPKGAIPMWLVNISQKGWPHNTLAAIKRLAMREDIPVLAKIEKYFIGKPDKKLKTKAKRTAKK